MTEHPSLYYLDKIFFIVAQLYLAVIKLQWGVQYFTIPDSPERFVIPQISSRRCLPIIILHLFWLLGFLSCDPPSAGNMPPPPPKRQIGFTTVFGAARGHKVLANVLRQGSVISQSKLRRIEQERDRKLFSSLQIDGWMDD